MVIVRPTLAVVHWAASGQVAQAGPNSALPACRAWPRTKRMATVTRLGHVTGARVEVDVEPVLGELPGRGDRGLHLEPGVDAGGVEPLQDVAGDADRASSP